MTPTTDDAVDYRLIEPGIRELCRALNAPGLPIRTLYSCEGHRPVPFAITLRPSRPFIIFRGRAPLVRRLQAALTMARHQGELHCYWTVYGAFTLQDQWQWMLTPDEGLPLTMFSFARERRFRTDIAAITGIVANVLASAPHTSEQGKKLIVDAKKPGAKNENNQETQTKKTDITFLASIIFNRVLRFTARTWTLAIVRKRRLAHVALNQLWHDVSSFKVDDLNTMPSKVNSRKSDAQRAAP